MFSCRLILLISAPPKIFLNSRNLYQLFSSLEISPILNLFINHLYILISHFIFSNLSLHFIFRFHLEQNSLIYFPFLLLLYSTPAFVRFSSFLLLFSYILYVHSLSSCPSECRSDFIFTELEKLIFFVTIVQTFYLFTVYQDILTLNSTNATSFSRSLSALTNFHLISISSQTFKVIHAH